MNLIDNKSLHAIAEIDLKCPVICYKGQITIEKQQRNILNNNGWSGAEITLLERLFTCRYYDRQSPVTLTMKNEKEPDISTGNNSDET